MVADNKIDASLPGICDLIVCLDAAVENDDEFHTLFDSHIDASARNAVALVIAGRDVVVDLRIEILQIAVDQRDGCRAVDIIVSVDHDFFLRSHRTVKTVDSLIHVGHQKRIVKVAQRGMEKLLCVVESRNSPLHQQFTYRGAISKAPRKFVMPLFVCVMG